MKRNFFFRLFPPPAYLEMRPAGLDFSDHSIKYCRLATLGGPPRLEVIGEEPLAGGAVSSGRIKDREAVVAALKHAAEKLGTKFVVLALSEEPGFTFTLSLPGVAPSELRQSIELQLEEHIPLPPAGVVFDYEPLPQSQTVAVSAYPGDLAAEYNEVLAAAGLVPLAFETEAQAMIRSLFSQSSAAPVLVADLGQSRSSFFVASGGASVLTSTVREIGGASLTKAVEKAFGLTAPEAEAFKHKRGLLQSKDKALLYALLPAISVLRDEINKFLLYWNSHAEERQSGARAISRVVLCGGEAVLPGLAEYLAASLAAPVELGNVWSRLLNVEETVPPLPLRQSLRYGTVLGLALRPLNVLES